MPRLGDVLEVIHSSRRRFRSARVVGRTGPSGWRMWWEGDDRYRFERDRQGATSVCIRNGRVWWTIHPDGGAHTNEDDPGLGLGMQPEFGLLHSRSLLAAALLEVVRDAEVARRHAAIVRVTPRRGADGWRWWGTVRPTEPAEIAIDLERGVVLDGLGSRVEEIFFDDVFSAETFSPEAEQTFEPSWREPREVSIEQARRDAPFRVRVPRWLPEGARLAGCLIDSAHPPGWVGLSWAIDPGHVYTVRFRDGPDVARDVARSRGTEQVIEGTRVVVAEPAGVYTRDLFVEIDGTWCEINSNLPLETMVAIALSVGGDGG